MNSRRLLIVLAATLAVIASVPIASALGKSSSSPASQQKILALTAVGSAFTYQGRLTDAGSPANGTYDFQFILYDALTGGTQIGTTQAVNDLQVTNGLFTTTLDFGATAFDGNARWLEIGVRPGAATGTYTLLSPRQAVTATPYALYAKAAGGVAVPFVATGTSTSPSSLLDVQQSGNGVGISAEAPTGTAASFVGTTGVFAGGGGALTTALQIDNGALKVSGANPTAFVHVASGGSYVSVIDNPLTNGDPNAILIVTHVYDPPGPGGPVYHTKPFGVWYNGTKWTIYNEDGTTAIDANDAFNVLVIKR
jgi:hypothetical protein